MTFEASTRTPPGAHLLLFVFVLLFSIQVGGAISLVRADDGGGRAFSAVTPDLVSDRVGATAAEFRVDESGAATYSIPLYVVPGTAGVAPKLTLSYSSQGGYGPVGKGWSIGGLSTITRCRSTRESGDFIVSGVPTDGVPAPVNFTATDRYCLDGQRLVPAQSNSAACPVISGMAVSNLRTEIESFQRICAYTSTTSSTGPAFFTVDRKDGSSSWYGDRDNDATANRPDGYFNSTTPGKEGFALSWAQTRFQDSTGNYIDFVYASPSGTSGEHVISEVRYTGKTVLSGQAGTASAPYAKVMFTYSARPADQSTTGYVAGGLIGQSRRLDNIIVCASIAAGCATATQARYYQLAYQVSGSGSGLETLSSVQECRDSSKGVCLAPTTFQWSTSRNELATQASWNPGYFGSSSKFEGFKLGDVDGDGRQDMVWLKDGSSGEACPTENIIVSFGDIDSSGRQSFLPGVVTGCTPTEVMTGLGPTSWQLFDYTGDGREDLFVAGATSYFLYPAVSRAQPFNTANNLLASIYIPRTATADSGDHPLLTDLNGDGLTDVVYKATGTRVRLMERSGSSFAWGAERTVAFEPEPPEECPPEGTDCNQNGPWLWNPEAFRLIDFNGDASSDLIMQINVRWTETGDCLTTESTYEGKRVQAVQTIGPGGGCVLHASMPVRYPYGVSSINATTVVLKRLGDSILYDLQPLGITRTGDVNGDGLTDLVYGGSQGWRYAINTGTGFLSPVSIGPLSNSDLVEVVDINGDSRSDVVFPLLDGDGYVRYHVRFALASGGFSGDQLIPGNGAMACFEASCDPRSAAHLFTDLDGDGGLDYFAVKIADSAAFFLSQPSSRFQPRDTLVAATNGLGSRTDITYASLVNATVYRRDYGSRDGTNWGRGSPVLDLIAPTYVVAKVSSTSPQPGAPDAKATLYYRYAGAKAQSGGRGFLGFREITTIDPNHVGGFVYTTTSYAQNFPFTGLPLGTFKAAVVNGTAPAPSCVNGAVASTCYATPEQGFASLGGNWFSDNDQTWEADTEVASTAVSGFAQGVQAPVHVRTAGTDENVRDPFGGTQTGRVVTTFDYGAYGNATSTQVDTYTGSSTLVSTQITANVYADDVPASWRLGRLTRSTVTFRRPSQADVVRVADSDYSMSGAATGLLTMERTQPGGTASLDLRKVYALDAYGNRLSVTSCSADVVTCAPSGLSFHPVSPTTVQRYTRTAYDALGRYPVATYEPFWNGVGAVEVQVQQVVARNIFGDVTQAYDINGLDTFAVPGTLGRSYYTWAETVPGSVPGSATGGVESFTSYRWCGTGGVTCPTGAKYRQKVVADESVTTWTYFDALGRPMAKASETFNVGVSGKDVAATCTEYDVVGHPVRVSNPFFLAGTSGGMDTASLASVCTASTLKWTTTAYDLLGRVTDVVGPDSSVASTDYVGLQTIVTDARGKVTTQVHNGKGELTQITNANGLVMTYAYRADGALSSVSRDAGRGAIVNAFTYDVTGRKIGQNDPDSGITAFEYNALGELVAQQDLQGNRIENEIDARGRIWRRTVKQADRTMESQATFGFDTAPNGLGKLASESVAGTYSGWVGQSDVALDFQRLYAYDSLGRPLSTLTTIDGVGYSTTQQYDTLGRPWKAQDVTGRWVKTAFNARGMGAATCNSSSTDAATACPADANTYVQALETDAWGHTTRERRGNSAAMDVVRDYWADTGRTASICAGNATTCNLVDEGYGWDAAGNLSTQQKENRYLETFTYDELNRLTQAKLLMQDGITVNQVTASFEYDALGNLCRKTGLGVATYDYVYAGRSGCGVADGRNSVYGGGGTGTVGPHQVSTLGAGNFFYYDGHGNQTVKDTASATYDRTIRYSLDDKAYEAVSGTGVRTRFWYGSDGQRYKREDGSKRTLYLGNVEVVIEGGVTTWKRTVAGVMLQTVVGATATNQYLFHDQLGSLVRITDAAGTVINSLDYQAFGARRDYDTQSAGGQVPSLTTRGFTGHEMVDGVLGLIHMSGRIFDPGLGRFLQADPLIQAPDNTQSWNAYTYVFNNPLRYTDPTGMLGIEERKWLAVIVAAVAAYFGQYYIAKPALAAAFIIGGAFVSGAIATQSMEGGLKAAFGAAITFGIMQGGYGYWGQVGAQAVTGGIMEAMQGGNFGHGFVAAGLTTMVMPVVGTIDGRLARTVVGAVVGGTLSEATGGKFANGAVSGAIQAAMAASADYEEVGSGDGGPAGETLIPEKVVVEEHGFDTPEGAAKAFGGRYYDKNNRAEYITAVVQTDDGWGYLAPGRGPEGVGRPRVKELFEAYEKAGFRPYGLAHTHPYGSRYFSGTDVRSMMGSAGGRMYVTNWNNETRVMSRAMIVSSMRQLGLRETQVSDFIRRLPATGYAGGNVP